MKRMSVLLSLVLITGALVACGGDQAAAPSSAESSGEQPAVSPGAGSSEDQPTTPASAEDGGEMMPPAPPGVEGDADWAATREAFFAVSQLAMGSLYLQNTENAITPEQATTLLPLWQELKSTQETGLASLEEINEMVVQIEAVMTQTQMDVIMNLSQEEMQAWAQEPGLGFGAGAGPGFGPGGPPEGERPSGTPPGEPPDLSPEEIATLQAERGGGRPGGLGMPMIDAVIEMLEALANA